MLFRKTLVALNENAFESHCENENACLLNQFDTNVLQSVVYVIFWCGNFVKRHSSAEFRVSFHKI